MAFEWLLGGFWMPFGCVLMHFRCLMGAKLFKYSLEQIKRNKLCIINRKSHLLDCLEKQAKRQAQSKKVVVMT